MVRRISIFLAGRKVGGFDENLQRLARAVCAACYGRNLRLKTKRNFKQTRGTQTTATLQCVAAGRYHVDRFYVCLVCVVSVDTRQPQARRKPRARRTEDSVGFLCLRRRAVGGAGDAGETFRFSDDAVVTVLCEFAVCSVCPVVLHIRNVSARISIVSGGSRRSANSNGRSIHTAQRERCVYLLLSRSLPAHKLISVI